MTTPGSARDRVLPILALCVMACAAMLAAGCAPARPGSPSPAPALTAAADSARALEAEVREVGTFPDRQAMLDDVTLYTELLAIRGSHEDPERDTLRGPAVVATWLERRRAEQSPDVLFDLETRRVYACDDAILQYGEYPIRLDPLLVRNYLTVKTVTGHREAIHPFAALWRRGADGALRLETLWLTPLAEEARPARLADGCRDTGSAIFAARYARRRYGVELAVGLEQASTTELEDALTVQEWDGRMETDLPLVVDLSGFYRVRDAWQLVGVASYQLPAGIQGSSLQGYRVNLERSGVLVGAMVGRELGRFRIAGGPALLYTRWSWSDEVVNRIIPEGEPTSGSSVLPGGLGELALIQTLRSRVYLHGALRYYLFGDAETPGFRDLDLVEVPMSGARFTVGIGWWW